MQRLSKYYPYLIFGLVGFIIAWLMFHSDPVNLNPSISGGLKAKVQVELKAADSVKAKVDTSDLVRLRYDAKFNKLKAYYERRIKSLKPDTFFIPCDTLLKKVVHICDTLRIVDSTEISQLNALDSIKTNIISDQSKIIKNDSLTILGLNKKLKRSRFWGKAGAITGFVGGFVLGKL